MTENQKLREAFETYITDDGKWPNAILKAPGGQYLLLRTSVAWHDWKACAGALALPTAGKMINGLTQAETDASASVSGLTAAPVGERDAFEHDLSKSPFEFDMDRWPDNAPVDWPGSYKQYHVQCAWDAWQARAALSAGDAVDAQRYRWLREQHWVEPEAVFRLGLSGTDDATQYEREIDAGIDAAMRKGQL